MENKRNLKKEQGITLMALIITIIILVILAAITISAAYISGIIQYGVDGAKKYASVAVEENKIMDKTTKYIESVVSEIKEKYKPEETKPVSELKFKDYVYYKTNYGNEVLCQVLYDSSYDETNKTEYGIQLYTVEDLCKLKLGYEDPYIPAEIAGSSNYDKSVWSYNNCIKNLNATVEKYKNVSLSGNKNARCVGTDPSNPSSGQDIDESVDKKMLTEIGLKDTDNFWLGYQYFGFSPHSDPLIATQQGCVAYVDNGSFPEMFSGEWTAYDPLACLYIMADESRGVSCESYSVENNVRGVFSILESAQIYGGDGSIEQPYHLK